MTAVIETRGLTKHFGTTVALDGLDLTVEEGTVHGFLGPNGAGKSTTIRILLGLLRATGGRARLFGQDPWRDAVDLHRQLAYVPGDVTLWPNLTGGEAIDLLTRLHGRHDPGRRADLLERFDLDPTKKGRSYSKGNRQKVALVAALASDVELLLLDEPTNGLDPNQIRQIRELIKGLAANHTIILSTHILSEVEMICNKVIIIDQGTIKAADTPSNLTANLRAAGKITLEFRGDLALITQKLENLEHVKKVIHEGTDADGWHTLTVRAEAGTDTREKAARLLAEQGCPLRHIYRHTPTLEEVFVEMTRKD